MTSGVLCLAIMLGAVGGGVKVSEHRSKTACSMMEHVIEESDKNNIRATLLLAMIYVESGW